MSAWTLVEMTTERVRALDAAGVVNVLSFGGMPHDVARENFDTYARDVLPRLREIDGAREICLVSARLEGVRS